jgi:hypothetical protein
MLRFQEPLAHLLSKHPVEGQPNIGVDTYSFIPSPRMFPRDQLAAQLAGLPGPSLIAPTTARGIVTVLLLHELGGDRHARVEKEFANQVGLLAEAAPGADADRVLLEFDDETHVFSLAALRYWARQYMVLVGWNIGPCRDPSRAEWQFNLFGGDGRRYSKGVGPQSL